MFILDRDLARYYHITSLHSQMVGMADIGQHDNIDLYFVTIYQLLFGFISCTK